MSVVLILVGAALLAVASEHFVTGAARLAHLLRISLVTVGIVIVGFGTSLPEALVSGLAAVRNDVDVALGNVVGSNVTNLSLLLGVGALVRPLVVGSQTIRREAPVTVGALVVLAVAAPGGLGPVDAVLMTLLLMGFLVMILRNPQEADPLTPEVMEAVQTAQEHRVSVEGIRTVVGLGGTLLGAHLLLEGAIGVADALGLAQGMVGLTLVAMGTSLPELTTVVQAARQNEPDLILGNLLGSCIFNALFVAAIIGFSMSGPFSDREVELIGPILGVVLAALVWAMMMTKTRRLGRSEGVLLLASYAGFLAWSVTGA